MRKCSIAIGGFRLLMVCSMIVNANAQTETTQNGNECVRNVSPTTITFDCPMGSTMANLPIDNLTQSSLDGIKKLTVRGIRGRGPLLSIPENICRFKQLEILDLTSNRIQKATLSFTSSCLPRLEELVLQNNFISEVPTAWIGQMSRLTRLYLAENKLHCLPYKMFYNLSNIEFLDVSFNLLTSLELWLVQVNGYIDLSDNPINRFTNNDNVDLSYLSSSTTRYIMTSIISMKIEFDDGVLEMFNRCGETNSSAGSTVLMQTIEKLHTTNRQLLNWRCQCDQYHLQKYMIDSDPSNNFSTWRCSVNQNISFGEQCSYQSSMNGVNIKPRLCKINNTEPGDVPIRFLANPCELDLPNSTDLELISSALYDKLVTLDPINQNEIFNFAEIIDRSNPILQSLSSNPMNKSIQANFQKIISRIEEFIEAINTTTNITSNSVSILTVPKNLSIYSYSQTRQSNLPLSYSTDTNLQNYIANITIDPISIKNLLETDIYTFYYLPSSLFHYAQEDQKTIIVSPIVGVHLINHIPHVIRMSFGNITPALGEYACVFWEANRWNPTGCQHSLGSRLTEHFCTCNHTTSFALIFIPDKTIRGTSLPTIIVTSLSIVCFCVSIILSIHRQATSFRYLSIANIFTLFNSLVFFILLMVMVIRGYQALNVNSTDAERCYPTSQNLAIATYFFLLATFASRTLLGSYYFLTIFFHLIFIQFTSRSNRWFYAGFFLVILIAIIPTLVIRQRIDLFQQNGGICWFHSSYVFRFVSIPIIVFVGLNILFVLGITIRLVQFFRGRSSTRINDRRKTISVMIWVALCVLLGIAWIFGPLMNVFIVDKDQLLSVVVQWIFGMFAGLEGVWMLIVNIVFYVQQRMNNKHPDGMGNNADKYQF